MEEKSPVGESGEGANLQNVGIKLRQKRNKLFKFPVIFQAGVHIGHGLALYQFLQGGDGRILVKVHRSRVDLGLRLGIEQQCPYNQHSQEYQGDT